MAYRQGVRKKAFGIRVRDVTVYKISSSFKIDCVSESSKPNAVYTPISSTAVLVSRLLYTSPWCVGREFPANSAVREITANKHYRCPTYQVVTSPC
jgi:hypothetical protein